MAFPHAAVGPLSKGTQAQHRAGWQCLQQQVEGGVSVCLVGIAGSMDGEGHLTATGDLEAKWGGREWHGPPLVTGFGEAGWSSTPRWKLLEFLRIRVPLPRRLAAVPPACPNPKAGARQGGLQSLCPKVAERSDVWNTWDEERPVVSPVGTLFQLVRDVAGPHGQSCKERAVL